MVCKKDFPFLGDNQDWSRRLETLEWEKSNLLLRLETASERADGLEKQLHTTEDLLRGSRQDMATLQRNFEVMASLVDDLKAQKAALEYKLVSMTDEAATNNNASLNRQRELLHQDRLAFTLERIAFDNQHQVC